MIVVCTYCTKRFYREKRRVNEALKFNWKPFCSSKCLSLYKNKQVTFKCGNPSCNNIFKRQPKEVPVSKICFCSCRCAAIINNPKSAIKLRKTRTCPKCFKQYYGENKYCSKSCVPKTPIISKGEIIKQILNFYEKHDRIPFKMEFKHYKAARNRFGTWNNAVKATGLKPNPLKFAYKHKANDGHICDSLSEKIIDDWLFARNINHLRSVPYGKNHMTADFKIGKTYIEFIGLQGELKSYDRLLELKEQLWKVQKLKIIKIFPNDLFPKNRLNLVLKHLL